MARSDRPNIFYGVTLHLWNAAQWTKTHKKVQICFEICFKLPLDVFKIIIYINIFQFCSSLCAASFFPDDVEKNIDTYTILYV